MEKGGDIQVCEVCTSQDISKVLDLGDHPLCDDLIAVDSAGSCEQFPIRIWLCHNCQTAHQEVQIAKDRLFPESYHYRARLTGDVRSGMSQLVDAVEVFLGSLRGRSVLDIGCNDGTLLDLFSNRGAQVTIGIEPTGAARDASGRQHRVINEYFDLDSAETVKGIAPSIDVITFTNVFAHIEDLPALLQALDSVMDRETLVVIENHYLGSILTRNQFDTFYHEHPRTYSVGSFEFIAKALDRQLLKIEFPHRYGGNIRVFIGSKSLHGCLDGSEVQYLIQRESEFEEKFRSMDDFISNWRREKLEEIRALSSTHGPLLAKAFPGRAAILLRLLGLTPDHLKAIYEKPSSPKIGHYAPGTRIPILSDEDLVAHLENAEYVVNLAWHIQPEIDGYLRKLGFRGRLVSIV